MRLKQLCIWITFTALLQCQAQQEAEEYESEQQQEQEVLAPSTMSAADPIRELAVEVATEAAATSGMITAASHMEETTMQDVAEELPMNDSPQSAEAEEAAPAALPEAEPESANGAPAEAPAEPAPLQPDDTVKPTAKPPMRNCYTCSGPQNASCNMQPKLQKLEECKTVANVDNFGCFSLVKPDTKLVMRGCLPDLAEEGQRYCKTHTKYCDICYKPGCNLNQMSGAIRIQQSWLTMSGLVILASWSVIH